MSNEELPADILQFITRNIGSVEQLEILLLLHRSSDIPWSIQGVYEVILSASISVERCLNALVERNVVQKTDEAPSRYRYSAAGETAVQIDNLAQLYKTKSVRVIEAIYKKPPAPAQGFADAFKLKPPL